MAAPENDPTAPKGDRAPTPAATPPAVLFDLTGKRAVVVGGTGVLGGAIAETLAAAGAELIIVGRGEAAGNEVADRIKAAGGSAAVITADATRREDLESLRDQLLADGGPPDVLVNAAGVNAATPFLEISDDEWHKIFRVNLDSVRLACQILGPAMLERGSGSIMNLASMSAEIPLSRVFTYSASKAAVLNLTRNLAREWAPQGVRVNALSPGFFPAEQNRDILSPDRVAAIMNHTPMNRFGEPGELAGAVLLLASDAGRFMTGTNLCVDGGFSAMTI
ncbi:SDR family NAD(P)-dependent oxidoreductase [Alienimonas californiensis]|nr:SDR family oxidoreductase [Alienimonas californiensis]